MKKYEYQEQILKAILDDPEGISMLEDMILQKSKRRQKIMEKHGNYLQGNPYPELQDKEIYPYFKEKVADLYWGEELRGIERDLRNMCWTYERFTGGIKGANEWTRKYEHATERVSIESVVSSLLGVKNPKKMIRCPFHEDRTPSLKLYPKKNRFICFGCNMCGSAIDFVMAFKRLDFKEAVEFLSTF